MQSIQTCGFKLFEQPNSSLLSILSGRRPGPKKGVNDNNAKLRRARPSTIIEQCSRWRTLSDIYKALPALPQTGVFSKLVSCSLEKQQKMVTSMFETKPLIIQKTKIFTKELLQRTVSRLGVARFQTLLSAQSIKVSRNACFEKTRKEGGALSHYSDLLQPVFMREEVKLQTVPSLIHYAAKLQSQKEKIFIKRSVISDKAGKFRTISKAPAHVHTLLNPINNILLELLKSTPTGPVLKGNKLDHYLSQPKTYMRKPYMFSADLSKATDLIPHDIAVEVWYTICEELNLPRSIKSLGKKSITNCYLISVNKETGQTEETRITRGLLMGLPLVWPILNILNQFCAEYKQKNLMDKSYGVFGDDLLAIWAQNHIIQYKKNIESIGLSLNTTKTLVSRNFGVFCEEHYHFTTKFSVVASSFDLIPNPITQRETARARRQVLSELRAVFEYDHKKAVMHHDYFTHRLPPPPFHFYWAARRSDHLVRTGRNFRYKWIRTKREKPHIMPLKTKILGKTQKQKPKSVLIPSRSKRFTDVKDNVWFTITQLPWRTQKMLNHTYPIASQRHTIGSVKHLPRVRLSTLTKLNLRGNSNEVPFHLTCGPIMSELLKGVRGWLRQRILDLFYHCYKKKIIVAQKHGLLVYYPRPLGGMGVPFDPKRVEKIPKTYHLAKRTLSRFPQLSRNIQSVWSLAQAPEEMKQAVKAALELCNNLPSTSSTTGVPRKNAISEIQASLQSQINLNLSGGALKYSRRIPTIRALGKSLRTHINHLAEVNNLPKEDILIRMLSLKERGLLKEVAYKIYLPFFVDHNFRVHERKLESVLLIKGEKKLHRAIPNEQLSDSIQFKEKFIKLSNLLDEIHRSKTKKLDKIQIKAQTDELHINLLELMDNNLKKHLILTTLGHEYKWRNLEEFQVTSVLSKELYTSYDKKYVDSKIHWVPRRVISSIITRKRSTNKRVSPYLLELLNRAPAVPAQGLPKNGDLLPVLRKFDRVPEEAFNLLRVLCKPYMIPLQTVQGKEPRYNPLRGLKRTYGASLYSHPAFTMESLQRMQHHMANQIHDLSVEICGA
jgi:hypothetical protein